MIKGWVKKILKLNLKKYQKKLLIYNFNFCNKNISI